MALRRLKTLLAFVLGIGLATMAARLLLGLGVSTNLSHQVSWGLWNAVKISLVPLSAGGFVLAALVYVFGLERFRPVLRLGLVTGFLGYATFATLLVFDLGVPTRIWHPLVFWQPHSVLFEVAWCVMLYLTVLALEFAPVALEHPRLQHPLARGAWRLLRRLTVPLVIAGIVLSTLHQSSLGSLFLIAPHRLDPLFYSPLLPVAFLVSAVGMGFLVVTVEAFLLGALYRVPVDVGVLWPLARAGGAALLLFACLRVGDLAARGVLPGALASPRAPLFVAEVLLAGVVPALLLLPRVATGRRALLLAASGAVAGVVLHRASVALLAIDGGGAGYRPSWMEIALAAGVLAAAALVFLALVEHLRIHGELAPPRVETRHGIALDLVASPFRRASFALVLGIAAGILLLPPRAFGLGGPAVPARAAGTVAGLRVARASGPTRLLLAPPGAVEAHPLLLVDGDRDDDAVLFDHGAHRARLGGDASCGTCHHLALPRDRAPACAACHADVLAPVSVFGHEGHVRATGGNAGCVACHAGGGAARTAATATPCADCHADLVAPQAFVAPPPPRWGRAASYVDAMHGLCRDCHARRRAEGGPAHLDRCDACHDPALASGLAARRPPTRPRPANAAAAREEAR